MSDVADLVKRAERLQDHVEALRAELTQLRKDLDNLQTSGQQQANGSEDAADDCLVVALAHPKDLGPDFSAENPDDLTGRGDEWFSE